MSVTLSSCDIRVVEVKNVSKYKISKHGLLDLSFPNETDLQIRLNDRIVYDSKLLSGNTIYLRPNDRLTSNKPISLKLMHNVQITSETFVNWFITNNGEYDYDVVTIFCEK